VIQFPPTGAVAYYHRFPVGRQHESSMNQPQEKERAAAGTRADARGADRIFSITLNVKRLKSICVRTLRRQAGNLAVLSLMIRKPRLVTLWLATARRAQLTLAIGLLALIALAPPAATWLSDALYPTRYDEQGPFQRLLDMRRPLPNPLRDARRDQFLIAAWVLGFGAVLVVLLGHVPKAVAIGRERAAALAARADKIAAADPERSGRLRATAEGLVIDDLTRDVVAGGRGTKTPAGSTMIISRSDPRTASGKHVGADRRYRLEKAIGSGGMGVVHAGTDTLLQRPVALKQLFSHLVRDAEQSSRFRQEALALARLTHPHIVTIHDLVDFDGHFWIVMELLSGGSLADRIDARGAIPAAESIEVACDIAAGLDYAHERGVVHRDVKPMNILFTADGKAKLADFGNAKLHESAVHTRDGRLLGSPAYMSPEQVAGAAIDARTDIYSLGISLYQMLTGRTPFEGELAGILAQHVSRTPDPPGAHVPGIPPALDEVALRMLEKAPNDRFRNCSELMHALRKAARSPRSRRQA